MTTAYTLKLFCFASDKKGTREVPRKILEESKEALSFMWEWPEQADTLFSPLLLLLTNYDKLRAVETFNLFFMSKTASISQFHCILCLATAEPQVIVKSEF